MSRPTVSNDDQPGEPVPYREEADRIATGPGRIGVRVERRHSPVRLSPQDPPEAILAACRPHPDRLMGECGAGSADVIKLDEHTANLAAVRATFLSAQTHTEDVTALRVFTDTTGRVAHHTGDAISDRMSR